MGPEIFYKIKVGLDAKKVGKHWFNLLKNQRLIEQPLLKETKTGTWWEITLIVSGSISAACR